MLSVKVNDIICNIENTANDIGYLCTCLNDFKKKIKLQESRPSKTLASRLEATNEHFIQKLTSNDFIVTSTHFVNKFDDNAFDNYLDKHHLYSLGFIYDFMDGSSNTTLINSLGKLYRQYHSKYNVDDFYIHIDKTKNIALPITLNESKNVTHYIVIAFNKLINHLKELFRQYSKQILSL